MPPPPAPRSRVPGGRVEAGESAHVGLGRGLEQLLGPCERLEELDREAHQRGVRGDVGRYLQVPAPRAPPVARPQVAQLHLDPVDRSAPSGPVPVLPPGRRLPREVRGVPITGLLEQTRLGQAVFPELADGLEEAVSGARAAVVGAHERLADQRVEQTEHIDLVRAVDDGTGARQVEAAREYRRQAEQFAFVLAEKVIGPLHGVAERELSFRPRLRGLQQSEPVRQPTPDLGGAHGRHPRRG